ncbi:MAG: hypothetical protein P8J27_17220, partial [Mariniblastus sp.]|nr:hypothetical protein [Mariniblastus sp.]
RDVQPFETGELKWVQVVIPISELEDSDGDVRLKDPTQNFGQSESAEIFKLDGEIGENEVDKIINAIETNQESEAGYWYKVFKDYRNRDDELFFYHYKTGDAQETTPEPIDASEGSKEQPEPSPESPNLNLQNDSETLPKTEAGLSDSDSEMEIVPKLNSSNLEQNEAELTPPSSQDNSNVTAPNRGSSLSAASLLMATLLVKKSKNKPTAHESSKPESNESLNHESQAPIVGFSRLDRLKRKVKRHLG